MKTLKISLLLFAASLCFSFNALANTVQSYFFDCSNGHIAHTFVIYDDNGHPTGACGINCDGQVWSKTWDWLVSTGGTPPVVVGIPQAVSAGHLTVRATQAVDLQIMDMVTCEFIGNAIAVSANTDTPVDVSSLPGGHLYGFFYSIGGKIATFQHYQKL